jgi:hypothetical protein
MRVTPATARTYLTDVAISGLAQSMAFGFVEENPGADLFAAPRGATIPVRLAGRVSAGLAEVVRIRLAEREDLEHVRESVAQLAHAQGVLGLVMADQVAQDVEGEPWIHAPRGLLHRLAATWRPRPAWWRTASSATTPIPLRPVVCRTRSAVTPSCCGRSPTARPNRG